MGKGQLEALGMFILMHFGSVHNGVPEETPIIVETLEAHVFARSARGDNEASSVFLASSLPLSRS